MTVERALDALRNGRLVLLADDTDSEHGGALVVAADSVTTDQMTFLIRHTTGVVCVPMTGERADVLGLPPMVAREADARTADFTISVDSRVGTTTGISAADRVVTVHALVDPATEPEDLARPGHVFPVRTRSGGVLEWVDRSEAAVDLVRLGGRGDGAVIADVVDDEGMPWGDAGLARFALEHELELVTVMDLVRHRLREEQHLRRVADAGMPTAYGDFRSYVYRSVLDGTEHLAFVAGDDASRDPILVRVHAECVIGDVFGVVRCECAALLASALGVISIEGAGILVYLRGREGNGLGHGRRPPRSVSEGPRLTEVLPLLARRRWVVREILADLGVSRIRLMTNDPTPTEGLGAEVVERVPVIVGAGSDGVDLLDDALVGHAHVFSGTMLDGGR